MIIKIANNIENKWSISDQVSDVIFFPFTRSERDLNKKGKIKIKVMVAR